MRALPFTLTVSLAAHVAIAAAFAISRPVTSPEAAVEPAPQLAGETFELPAPESAAGGARAQPPSEGSQEPATPADGELPAKPARRPRSPGAAPAQEGTASAGSDGRYGAVGDRSASDLATAFTRGFPQAASADPIWRTTPLGTSGSADVVLTLNASGQLDDVQVQGAPSTALANGIRRTMALIRARSFVARGRTTKLHVTATVSADAVHDGLHGEVFAIGGSFAGGEGNAFFALAIGRRVDLRVHQR